MIRRSEVRILPAQPPLEHDAVPAPEGGLVRKSWAFVVSGQPSATHSFRSLRRRENTLSRQDGLVVREAVALARAKREGPEAAPVPTRASTSERPSWWSTMMTGTSGRERACGAHHHRAPLDLPVQARQEPRAEWAKGKPRTFSFSPRTIACSLRISESHSRRVGTASRRQSGRRSQFRTDRSRDRMPPLRTQRSRMLRRRRVDAGDLDDGLPRRFLVGAIVKVRVAHRLNWARELLRRRGEELP